MAHLSWVGVRFQRFLFVFLFIFGVVFGVGGEVVAGATTEPLNTPSLENLQKLRRFQVVNDKLTGEVGDSNQWASSTCWGAAYYFYWVTYGADLEDLQIELNDAGGVDVSAKLKNLEGHATGTYRSGSTFCLPLGGTIGIGFQWATAKAQVTFGNSSELKDLKVKVTQLELGKIELGRWVPNWFEDFLTGLANRSLRTLWSSWLGDWLNRKISDLIRENLPEEKGSTKKSGGTGSVSKAAIGGR